MTTEEKVKDAIRDIPDFPKQGIVFKDITPILQKPQLCAEIVENIKRKVAGLNIQGVAGIESRGFLIGVPLAIALNVPFILIRKKGKLPYETVSYKYDLEYANYVGRKKKWIVDMQIYKGKLTNVIDNNELYIEFIDYLKINEKYELFKNELDVNNIIAHEVRYCKNDKTSLLYWIIKFKDEHVRQLIIDKPIQPVSPKILNADVCILTQLSCLRKRLLLKNDKLEYYVIILEIYKNNKCDKLTSYYDRKKKQYRCVCRTVINNEPRNNVI